MLSFIHRIAVSSWKSLNAEVVRNEAACNHFEDTEYGDYNRDKYRIQLTFIENDLIASELKTAFLKDT